MPRDLMERFNAVGAKAGDQPGTPEEKLTADKMQALPEDAGLSGQATLASGIDGIVALGFYVVIRAKPDPGTAKGAERRNPAQGPLPERIAADRGTVPGEPALTPSHEGPPVLTPPVLTLPVVNVMPAWAPAVTQGGVGRSPVTVAILHAVTNGTHRAGRAGSLDRWIAGRTSDAAVWIYVTAAS